MIECSPVDVQIFGPRVCTRCGGLFAASTDFFPRDASQKSGMHSWCRTCKSEKTMDWKRRKKSANGRESATITIAEND